MAKEEREMHKVMWPGYQYHKGTLGRKVRSESGSGSGIQSATGTDWNGTSSSVPYQLDDFVDFLPFATGPVRHSSCPPGKPKYIDPDWDSTLLQSSLVPRTLLITRDDLARRPSRVLMYASDPTFLSTPNAEGEEIVTSPPSHGMPTTFSWHHVSQTTQHLIDMQEMGRKILDVRPTPVTGAYLCMAQCYPGLYEYEQATQGSFAGVDQYRYDLWNDDDFSNPRFRGPSSLLASLDPKSFDISCFTSLCPTQLGRDLASSPASSITSIAPTAASDWVIPEYKLP
ncbi:hypothetical protein H0H92_009007 [Tricholoma furcatifolium]|nr:hypothetical protein H0H92_009007 [Tricholoma furcatifolium]